MNLSGVALGGIRLPADLPIPITVPFDTVTVATIGGTNEAFLGHGANVNTVGALSVTATTTNDASADLVLLGLHFVNVGGSQSGSLATVTGATRSTSTRAPR